MLCSAHVCPPVSPRLAAGPRMAECSCDSLSQMRTLRSPREEVCPQWYSVCLTPCVLWKPLQEGCSHPFLRPSHSKASLIALQFIGAASLWVLRRGLVSGGEGWFSLLVHSLKTPGVWSGSMALELQSSLKRYFVCMPSVFIQQTKTTTKNKQTKNHTQNK